MSEGETMNYEQVKNMYDNLSAALDTVTGWHTDQSMLRSQREMLFKVEDQLGTAAEQLFELMGRRFKSDPEWRRWTIREGWLFDDLTPEEQAYADSLD